MKALLLATAVVFSSPVIAMTIEEAQNAVEVEEDAGHCAFGILYDGGPKLSEAEIKAACDKYEEAMNTLRKAGKIK